MSRTGKSMWQSNVEAIALTILTTWGDFSMDRRAAQSHKEGIDSRDAGGGVLACLSPPQ